MEHLYQEFFLFFSALPLAEKPTLRDNVHYDVQQDYCKGIWKYRIWFDLPVLSLLKNGESKMIHNFWSNKIYLYKNNKDEQL